MTGVLMTLVVLFAGQAFGQENGFHYTVNTLPQTRVSSSATPASANVTGSEGRLPPSAGSSNVAVAPGTSQVQGSAIGWHASAEYLLFWFKNSRIPPLVTTDGNGRLGSPGTRVLVDNLDFAGGVRQGGRFALAYHFQSTPRLSVEANYFFMADKQRDTRIESDGEPFLAQPFLDAVNGTSDATVVAQSGLAMGQIIIGSRTSLSGAEANLAVRLISSDRFRVATIGGFRFMQLKDRVTSGERFLVSPSVPGFGGSTVTLNDDFRTLNTFYGGQVGLEAGGRRGLLVIDAVGKIAIGQMKQGAKVNGVTSSLSPNGSTTVFQGGLYALRSNSGHHQRNDLAFIPEVGLKVGLQLARGLWVSGGYSFMWVSAVTRAGQQIDPVVNVSQFPIRSGNAPLVGPARPAFNFDRSNFWAQGLKVGLELRY